MQVYFKFQLQEEIAAAGSNLISKVTWEPILPISLCTSARGAGEGAAAVGFKSTQLQKCLQKRIAAAATPTLPIWIFANGECR